MTPPGISYTVRATFLPQEVWCWDIMIMATCSAGT